MAQVNLPPGFELVDEPPAAKPPAGFVLMNDADTSEPQSSSAGPALVAAGKALPPIAMAISHSPTARKVITEAAKHAVASAAGATVGHIVGGPVGAAAGAVVGNTVLPAAPAATGAANYTAAV